MISIQITNEQMRNPAVLSNLQALMSALGDQPTQTVVKVVDNSKKNSTRKAFSASAEKLLDEAILNQYGDLIKAQKALYVMSILRKNRTLSTTQIVESLQRDYPGTSAKAIGGVMGALTRWFKQSNKNIPFITHVDQYGTKYLTWSGK